MRKIFSYTGISIVLLTVVSWIFSSWLLESGWMPHAYCYAWEPELVWLHLVSDTLIWLSYTVISTILWITAIKLNKGVFYNKILLLFTVAFGVFIMSCGLTHLLEVTTLFVAVYNLSAIVKIICAMASVATAATLVYFRKQITNYVNSQDSLAKDLMEYKLRLDKALQSRTSSIVNTDVEGNIDFWNDGSEQIFGYSKKEILGKPIQTIISKRFIHQYNDGIKDFIKNNSNALVNEIVEMEGIDKYGKEFPIELAVSSWSIDNNLFFTLFIRDITNKKSKEDTLKKQAAISSSIVNSMGDGVIGCDDRGIINLFNPAARRIYNLPAEENPVIERSNVYKLFKGSDRAYKKIALPLIRAINGASTDDIEDVASRQDGNGASIWLSVSSRPILVDGKIQGGLVVLRDISIRKDMEAKLELANEELKKKTEALMYSNRELEQFAYVASHDLQEPLRMISSYTELLIKGLDSYMDDKHKLYASFITEGTGRMSNLISDLLVYSRLKSINMEPSKVDMNECLYSVLSGLNSLIIEHKAKITNDNLPCVRIAKIHATQLLQNLIGNALKFSKPNLCEISISAELDGNTATFSVKDNGIGIPKEYSDKVFVIFQRLHNRTQYPGTGIGLSICKKIVESYGGQIWFDSEVGEGTTFYFTLPVCD